MLTSRKHLLAYSFLFIVALTARSFFTEPIEAGGDAIQTRATKVLLWIWGDLV